MAKFITQKFIFLVKIITKNEHWFHMIFRILKTGENELRFLTLKISTTNAQTYGNTKDVNTSY